MAIITPPYACLACLIAPLPHRWRYTIITSWSHAVVALARHVCGIRFRVLGREHLPVTGPYILMLKHTSAWETLAAQVIFPPQVWVLKQELLWIPFFGWGLRQLQPIAINRRGGARAVRHMVEQAQDRVNQGLCIVIFPEGTRTRPGERVEYKSGAGHVARALNVPVIPVAHNAGYLWSKEDWCRYPGEITVEIAPALTPAAYRDAKSLIHDVEHAIEDRLPALGQPAEPA